MTPPEAGAALPKVWFITGTSRGFGRAWAEAALARGDKVAATARDTGALRELTDRFGDHVLPIALDVDDREADVAAVAEAHDAFGRLDVVVNNAGYGQFGFVEEVSEAEARAQLETNLFGALWVTQAALPFLRSQGSGHIVQVTSVGGVTAFPDVGIYHASKWALEGFSQSLAAEVAPFGIKVTMIEPGGFATDWAGSSARWPSRLAAYDDVRATFRRATRSFGPPGDTRASAQVVLRLVDLEDPPLRLFLGPDPLGIVTADYLGRLQTWERFHELSVEAQGVVDEPTDRPQTP